MHFKKKSYTHQKNIKQIDNLAFVERTFKRIFTFISRVDFATNNVFRNNYIIQSKYDLRAISSRKTEHLRKKKSVDNQPVKQEIFSLC